MPITPSEARQLQQVRTVPPPEMFSRIDIALGNGNRTFAVPEAVPRQYLEGVKAAYARVGWKVTLVSDQRGGDYLEFKG